MMENHVHIYDAQGQQICCLEEKIDQKTPPSLIVSNIAETDHGHEHSHENATEGLQVYLPAAISFTLLMLSLALDKWWAAPFFSGWIKVGAYLLAYLPVAIPVLREAWHSLLNGQVFTEFFLMSIATIGAMAIGEYPEAVAVMLFYAVGELFQTAAVKKSKNNIRALLDVRPQIANVLRRDTIQVVHPNDVMVGETIQVKVGEKVPLDGTLLSPQASLNTSALTGESKPQTIRTHEKVLAGSINMSEVIEVRVDKPFNESSIARILHLVQDATTRKSKTELLIRKLAKIYTPIVVYAAIAIVVVPFFFVAEYDFSDWLYRALIFLVISCPCALVISIPLGYFGGLGAASKQGLLFKGAMFLDKLTEVNSVVLDKTGTLTKGVFKIQQINIEDGRSKSEFMQEVMALEKQSNHPIAKAIMEYGDMSLPPADQVTEHAGMGLSGIVDNHQLLIGNRKLLENFEVTIPPTQDGIEGSHVLVARDGTFAGSIIIADQLKDDVGDSMQELRQAGVNYLALLSGDEDQITQAIASKLQLDYAKGNLLPEDKLHELEQMQSEPSRVIAFVGDGINDAPALAASDVGIAMGGLGSDVAIETADVIIQTDQPGKIALGIKIGRATKRIIWQNIALAFGVKALVLVLGAGGLATMWEAVFADVGVALLAILNAIRLQRMEWT